MRSIIVLGCALVALALINEPAIGADPRLVEAAEREGQLMIYGCDVSEAPMQIKNFEKLYPKIKVSSYVAGCSQVFNRHSSERSAGKALADLFSATEDVLLKLDDGGELQPYESPELRNFGKSARPAGTNYTLYKVIIAGLTSNVDVMKGLATPSDWIDFAAPRPEWKDKISFYDPRTSSAAFLVLATLYQNLGSAKAAQIYAGLRKAGAELAATTPAGVSKVLSGEKPIMFYILTNQYGVVTAKGAPLVFTVPKSGAMTLNFGVAPFKGTRRTNAARLFIDYMLTDGQKIVAERAEYGLRNDAPAPKGLPRLNEIKIMPTDLRAALREQPKLLTWWQEQAGVR